MLGETAIKGLIANIRQRLSHHLLRFAFVYLLFRNGRVTLRKVFTAFANSMLIVRGHLPRELRQPWHWWMYPATATCIA